MALCLDPRRACGLPLPCRGKMRNWQNWLPYKCHEICLLIIRHESIIDDVVSDMNEQAPDYEAS